MLKTIQVKHKGLPAIATFERWRRYQGQIQVMEWIIRLQDGTPVDRFDILRRRFDRLSTATGENQPRQWSAWTGDTMHDTLKRLRQVIADRINQGETA